MLNPFAGLDIMVPEDYRPQFELYVQRQTGKGARPVHQPFARNIDMWFAAICIAVKKGLRPVAPAGKLYKAAEGVVLSSDPWRPTALVLLAIAESKNDVAIIKRPGEMLRIASQYAAAGLPELFSMLDERGGDTALDHLSEQMEHLLKERTSG
jgi:hypothetical protein